MLYGLMLDRMGLSVKNGWMDSADRVYIYFTQEEAMDAMQCGKDKITRLFRELDQNGIGLIARRKQGQGRPERVYARTSFCPWSRNRLSRISPRLMMRPRLRIRSNQDCA